MTQLAYAAPPLSRAKIEAGTMAIRRLAGMNDPFLPIIDLIEYALDRLAPGFRFEVLDKGVMGTRHGVVDVHSKMLALREDVYEGAIELKGRDRFTAAHELGHAVLHGRALNRLAPGTRAEAFRCPEWQANSFASALLAPERMARAAKSIGEIAEEFGITHEAARVRAKVLRLNFT